MEQVPDDAKKVAYKKAQPVEKPVKRKRRSTQVRRDVAENRARTDHGKPLVPMSDRKINADEPKRGGSPTVPGGLPGLGKKRR